MEGTSKSLFGDIKGVLFGNGAAMLNVGKNAKYFGVGLAILALVQVVKQINAWFAMKRMAASVDQMMGEYDQLGEFGDLFQDMVFSYAPQHFLWMGLSGFIFSILSMLLLYAVISGFYKGSKPFGAQGFITLMCFMSVAGLLTIIPSVGGFLAFVWALVLYFLMMKRVYDYGFLPAFGIGILTVLAALVLMIPIGLLLGAAGLSYGLMNAGFDASSFSSNMFNF